MSLRSDHELRRRAQLVMATRARAEAGLDASGSDVPRTEALDRLVDYALARELYGEAVREWSVQERMASERDKLKREIWGNAMTDGKLLSSTSTRT